MKLQSESVIVGVIIACLGLAIEAVFLAGWFAHVVPILRLVEVVALFLVIAGIIRALLA